jgi:hypothetical protein
VACLLRARIAEPEEMAVARELLYKHISMATHSCDCSNRYTNATSEELLEAVFSMRSVPTLYKETV